MNRKTKKIILKLNLLFFTLIIFFSVSELFCRINYKQHQKRLLAKYEGRDLCIRFDKDLIYAYYPNKCGFNAKGYFDYEYSLIKPKGVFRIILIGDSVADSPDLKKEESFAKLLEKRLNETFVPNKFEVIKLARVGYSTGQEIILLKKEAFRYQPDLILWSYCLNDPAHPIFHAACGEISECLFVPKLYSLYYLQEKIFLLQENIKARKCSSKRFEELLHCVYWDRVERNIKEIGCISKERKVPVIFLIHPSLDYGSKFCKDDYRFLSLHKRLYSTASQYGLVPLDLLECYKQYDPSQIEYQKNDPYHLNPEGHRAVAKYLFGRLQQYWRKVLKDRFIANQ